MKTLRLVLLPFLLFLLAPSASAAQADIANSRDYPAFTRMPGFYISHYDDKIFDAYPFRVGNDKKSVSGRKVVVGYTLSPNQPGPSQLQIIQNFTQATKKAGGEVLAEDAGSAYLRLTTAQGQKIWTHMQAGSYGTNYTLTIIEEGGMKQDVTVTAEAMPAQVLAGSVHADAPNSRDYPAFTRMPGFYIGYYDEKGFDAYPFRVGNEKKSVSGRKFVIDYSLSSKQPAPSQLQIVQNLLQATKKAGGEVLAEDAGSLNLRLTTAQGQKIWAEMQAAPYGTSYKLTIVEEGGMKQDVTVSAEAMAQSIVSTGHVAVYGIHFDTDKTTWKPESEPTLAELAKLLKANPSLKVWIVGHTDNVGDLAHNQTLSDGRAAAVMAALVSKHGIAQNRLRAIGVGPVAPVSTNRTEEGRALNRRVEIAEQ
jgi:OmpA-OmpF porin, OOP family